MNPFGSKAIREEDEDDFRDGASTPETVDEDLNNDAGDPGGTAKGALQKNDAGATFEMTVNHSKLLILISKYAQVALTVDDQELWLRQLSLYVLLYEGIAVGQLDYDYSPVSVFVSYDGSSRRIYMNISQEGKAAIDELREQKLINGLKIATEDFQPITAYQVSLKGLQFLKTLPNSLFEEVNNFLYAPNAPHYETELLESSFNGEKFVLRSKSGFQRDSQVTMTEDVSYVGIFTMHKTYLNVRPSYVFIRPTYIFTMYKAYLYIRLPVHSGMPAHAMGPHPHGQFASDQ